MWLPCTFTRFFLCLELLESVAIVVDHREKKLIKIWESIHHCSRQPDYLSRKTAGLFCEDNKYILEMFCDGDWQHIRASNSGLIPNRIVNDQEHFS